MTEAEMVSVFQEFLALTNQLCGVIIDECCLQALYLQRGFS